MHGAKVKNELILYVYLCALVDRILLTRGRTHWLTCARKVIHCLVLYGPANFVTIQTTINY
jgi:hypothetical protein